MQITLKQLSVGDIQLNKTQIPKIEQKIFSIQPQLKNNIVQNLQPLQTIAKSYIDSMKIALSMFKQIVEKCNNKLQIIDRIQQGNTTEAKNYAIAVNQHPTMNDVVELQRKLILLTDTFTMNLFKILGKKLELVYVYQSRAANVVQIYKIQKIEDLLKMRVSKSGQNIESRLSASKKVLQNLNTRIKKEDYYGGIDQAEKLDKTYKEIIRRYNKYRYQSKDGGKGRFSLVLWNMVDSPKWHSMFLYQKGDLGEAYANYALGRHQLYLHGNVNNPPETDIETFMHLVEQVDATFGGVQGDIQSIKKDTEIAVKSLSAAPQGIIDSLTLAQDLLTGNVTVENFDQYKEKWKKQGRNTIFTILNDTVRDSMISEFKRV